MNRSNPEQVGKSKATVIEKMYDWGVYVWEKSNGKWFTDGSGNILNIPSMKGDLSKLAELQKAAAYHGESEGKPVFFAGLSRVTDEEYSEQKNRMAEGLLPNMNDLGAVYDAKKTLSAWGDEG
jgi:dihydroorotase-like cyclic amidohydrolase